MRATLAFAMQDGRSITAHAGRCRRFLLATLAGGEIDSMRWVELDDDATLCRCGAGLPSALADIDLLVAAGVGDRLRRRLARHGVRVVLAHDAEPTAVLTRFLNRPSAAQRGAACGSEPHPSNGTEE